MISTDHVSIEVLGIKLLPYMLRPATDQKLISIARQVQYPLPPPWSGTLKPRGTDVARGMFCNCFGNLRDG